MTKKIPIAHLVSLATVGGVERFFTNFATDSQDIFEHHVFLSTDEVHEFFKPKLAEAGVKTYSLRKWRGIYLPATPAFMRRRLHHGLVEQTGVEALVLWNKLEFFPVHFPPGLKLIHFERGSAWLAQGKGVKEHLSRCYALLANSQAGLKLIDGRWGLPENKPVRVAHNGVNPLFTETPAPIKTKGEVVRLGFAGRFVSLKGWVLALLTLQQLHQRQPGRYRLVIGGKGPQKALFERLVTEWQLSELVEDMGLVKDMRQFFARIDIFLHTSLREPFGNVAVEAQALGCPVVGGWIDGNPEIIRDGETGILLPMDWPLANLQAIEPQLCELPPFVWDPLARKLCAPVPMSPIKMADAVEKISADSATLTAFSERAARWIRDEYDFKRRAQFLQLTLKELLTLKQGP